MLDEREFELINIIGQKLGSNQRDLSRQMELSLGQTNMLIRRLAAKGYIRITQLNQRKVKYLLTAKGITEKMRKSVKYTINTINSIGLIQRRLAALLTDLYGKGHRTFYVLGESDLIALVKAALQEKAFADSTFRPIEKVLPEHKDGIIFVCTEKYDPQAIASLPHIKLIEELARDDAFVNGNMRVRNEALEE